MAVGAMVPLGYTYREPAASDTKGIPSRDSARCTEPSARDASVAWLSAGQCRPVRTPFSTSPGLYAGAYRSGRLRRDDG